MQDNAKVGRSNKLVPASRYIWRAHKVKGRITDRSSWILENSKACNASSRSSELTMRTASSVQGVGGPGPTQQGCLDLQGAQGGEQPHVDGLKTFPLPRRP